MSKNSIETRGLKSSYDDEQALRICELIAEGRTLSSIAGTDGLPARATIYRWLAAYPKFFDAFERAKEVSAMSLEEEALEYARRLAGSNDFTGTKVQAYNYAMQQLRWSASRRDKTRYGQAIAPTNLAIPIQINTTLNLGQEGQPDATDNTKSVYTIEATVGEVPSIVSEVDESVLDLHTSGEVLDMQPDPADNDTFAVALDPAPPSRPKLRRKAPADVARMATRRAGAAKRKV